MNRDARRQNFRQLQTLDRQQQQFQRFQQLQLLLDFQKLRRRQRQLKQQNERLRRDHFRRSVDSVDVLSRMSVPRQLQALWEFVRHACADLDNHDHNFGQIAERLEIERHHLQQNHVLRNDVVDGQLLLGDDIMIRGRLEAPDTAGGPSFPTFEVQDAHRDTPASRTAVFRAYAERFPRTSTTS